MKTWPRFLTNLSNKLRRPVLAGALGLSLAPAIAFGGFYSDFKQLIDIQESNYNKKLEKLAGETSSLNDLSDPNEAKLDPDFLNSLIFHTPSRYAALGGASDQCGLYDLILSNLAQGPNGDLERFVVRYKTKEGSSKTALVGRQDFFNKVAFAQCPQVKKFQAYFQLENLPRTLKTVHLQTPVSQSSCREAHRDFVKDPKAPYLCYLSERIKAIPELEKKSRTTPRSQYRKLQKIKTELRAAKRYKSMLNPDATGYLDSLCLNIESEKAFCDGFFNSSFWRRVVRKEKSKAYMERACQELLKKRTLSDKDISECARTFEKSPHSCRFLGKRDQGLMPRPACDHISQALNLSRLKADYHDCPGGVANPGIVNLSRILAHFSGESPPPSDFCHASSTASFVRFNLGVTDGRFWQTAMCYQDKINNEEVCLPAVYGAVKGEEELSLDSVVAKILRKTKGFGNDQECRMLPRSEYRPELLEFKSGCFILVDPQDCFGTSCDIEILLNQKEITHIKQKSGAEFDYFAKDFANANYAQAKMLATKLKLNSKRVSNASAMKRVLDQHANALIHGVACAEDLYPEFFAKKAFNQCSPLPFIIDGYKEKKGQYSAVVRTGIDALSAPRLTPWNRLFAALKDYQRLHPLNSWGLNALY